ncbi:hypothetical protein F4556_000311 [Kitasatospora gansuensis]|uniref:SMI1/KNR4 family protein n=1 Tax=Kitasatospora gansuensis TaxID=258050 RepID=A0A7W7WF17_9ACTN|nr:hypothetical protein [Kitasatospora gansuensis]MBB4944776.1 hypothetical protein [Kitasatospora gansuensis]
MNDGLPDGWTIERVRTASRDAEAELLPLERLVVLEEHGHPDYTPLRPDLILSFHGLCLVRSDDDWYMGDLDTDGSIVCWSSYGTDLGEAIRGL